MQYYIWQGDESSTLLAARLLAAADRGVRVRLLLDDFYRGGAKDFSIAAADRHPNIEIRLFNPQSIRKRKGLRGIELVTRVSVLKHRMHNKLFAADNQLAIVGGRNIGDVYFGVSEDHNYRDLDVLAAGPVVSEISQSFDSYWNSAWAIPIAELERNPPSPEESEKFFREIRARADEPSRFPFSLDDNHPALLDRVTGLCERLVWASAQVAVDTPSKVAGDTSQNVGAALQQLAEATRAELLVVSPYLIPMSKEMAGLAPLAARGVEITILMNSMASTDVPIAQVGYSRHRRRLLEMGATLHELRADAPSRQLYAARDVPHSRLSLHAKAAVFDREVVYIGSYNIDRLGANVITEIGLIIQSPELAGQLLDLIQADLQPENAWRIQLEEEPDGRVRMVWSGSGKEGEVRALSEPGVGFGRRTHAAFLSLFPIR